MDWFRQNAFDPRLRTHKLRESLKGYWSFSLTRRHRVLFRFLQADVALFFDVGDHRRLPGIIGSLAAPRARCAAMLCDHSLGRCRMKKCRRCCGRVECAC